MFDLSEQEIDELQEEFKVLVSQMELLEKIDTDGVEPMIYPFEAETSYIREDEVAHVLTAEAALRNAADVLSLIHIWDSDKSDHSVQSCGFHPVHRRRLEHQPQFRQWHR